MRPRFLTRRSILSLLLVYVLALQAVLLALGGTQAGAGQAGGQLSLVCLNGASSVPDGSDVPGKRDAHAGCLSACLTGHAPVTPTIQSALNVLPGASARLPILQESRGVPASARLAFLARAPPV